jgi:hypothetical protein
LKVIRDNIDKLETIIKSTTEQLGSQNNLIPIQSIKGLFIKKCSVRDLEPSGWGKHNVIRFDVPTDCVKLLNKMNLDIKGDEVWGYYHFEYNNDKSREKFIRVLDAIEEIDKTTDEENLEISKNNIHTRDTILKMLTDTGVPTKEYKYPTSRSRTKDWVSRNWYGEINSSFPIYVSNMSSIKTKLIETFDKLYKADQDKRKLEEENKQQEIDRKENERLLAFMLAKYNLDITSDREQLQDAIINKNKYLYLAHYLCMNRGDWNDGYSYAKVGLRNFEVETDQDQEIYDEINNIITTCEDVDGRYFRDCNWNYNVLFEIVNKENSDLYSDYQKAKEHVEEF